MISKLNVKAVNTDYSEVLRPYLLYHLNRYIRTQQNSSLLRTQTRLYYTRWLLFQAIKTSFLLHPPSVRLSRNQPRAIDVQLHKMLDASSSIGWRPTLLCPSHRRLLRDLPIGNT